MESHAADISLYQQALVVLGAAGVVIPLFHRLRVSPVLGFMLVGIVVKNAILVVEFTNQLRERGMDARDAILRAAPMRLRPILMTTLATVGGMLPIAIGLEAGSEQYAPLARALLGGVAISAVVSIFLVPTVYYLIHRNEDGPEATHLSPSQEEQA